MKTSEPELAEDRETKTNADEFAEAKRKLEDELRSLKELLEMREKDTAEKEANVRQLQKDMSEMQAKVCRVESRIDPKS